MWSHFWRHGFEFCTSLIFIFVIYCLFQNLWTKLTFYLNGIIHANSENKKGIIYIYILHNRKVWKKSYLQKLFIHHLQLTIMKKKSPKMHWRGGSNKNNKKMIDQICLAPLLLSPILFRDYWLFYRKRGEKKFVTSFIPIIFNLKKKKLRVISKSNTKIILLLLLFVFLMSSILSNLCLLIPCWACMVVMRTFTRGRKMPLEFLVGLLTGKGKKSFKQIKCKDYFIISKYLIYKKE